MNKVFNITKCFFLTIIILILVQSSTSVPTYFIAAPKHLERWNKNNLAVSLFNVPKPTNVTATVNSVSKMMTFPAVPVIGQTLIFSFEFGADVKNGDYPITVTGVGGMPFTQTIPASMVYSKYVLIFQSTSLVYSPGDLVIFRVIILDEKFLPVKDKWISNSQITIMDPANIKRAVFHQVAGEIKKSEIYGESLFNISKGVTNDIAFRLDSQESTGTWQIQMLIDETNEIYKFDVEDNNPNFAYLELNATNYKTYTNSVVDLTIQSQYYFGENVKGVANIEVIKIKDCGKVVPAENRTSLMKQCVNFEKMSKVTLRFGDTPGLLNPRCDDIFDLEVSVNDSLTGQIYTESMKINFIRQNIKVRAVNKNEKLKIGMKFRAILEFSYIGQDDFSFAGIEEKLKIEAIVNKNHPLISSNIVKSKNRKFLDYTIEAGTLNMTIAVSISGTHIFDYTYLALPPNCAKTLLTINYQDSQKQLKINEIVDLVVSSNEAISKLNYYFIVDRKIVNASSVVYSTPATVVNFNLRIDQNIMPKSKIVIYMYSSTTQTIAQDYIDIEVSDYFQNYVKVSIDDQESHGHNLTHIKIHSEPQSNILIHAYNVQNLNNMRRDNLFERQIVKNWKKKMANYDLDDPIASNIMLVSNAPSYCATPYDLTTFMEDGHPVNYYDEDSMNKDFKQTWIWDKLNILSHDTLNITALSPRIQPAWQFSAISLHEVNGIGIAKEPIQMKNNKQFLAQVNNLMNLKQFKEHEFNLLVHNPLSKRINVLVKFDEILRGSPKVKFNNCNQDLLLESHETLMVNCSLLPLKVGQATLSLKGRNMADNSTIDYLEKTFDIHFEGFRQTIIEQKIVEFDQDADVFPLKYNWTYPVDMVKKSQRLFIMGNIEGIINTWYNRLLTNLIDLSVYKFLYTAITCNLRMPRFFSHISALKYLKAAELISASVIETHLTEIATEHNQVCMNTPYDGSVISQTFAGSAVTPNLKSSTWMTAQYLKSIKDYTIMRVLNKNRVYYTTAWLKKRELFTGEFLETDENFVVRPNINNYAVYLTAFSYISLESDLNFVESKSEVLNYLADQYPHLETNYEKSITCLTFHIAGHSMSEQCLTEFLQFIKSEKDYKYVQDNAGKADIEATSYGLLLAIKRKHFSLGYEFYKYFKTIQAKDGTIGDVFQTSLALDAMAELVNSAKFYRDTAKKVDITINNNSTISLKDNTEITQILELSPDLKAIDLKISGFGRANIFFAIKYNSKNKSITNMKSQIETCKIIQNMKQKYQMREIDLPSGLEYDTNGKIDPNYGKVEANTEKTHVTLYTDLIDRICYTIPVKRTSKFKLPNPAPIQLYPTMDSTKFKVYELE